MAYEPTHWVAHPDSLAKTQEAAAAINKLEQAVADLSITGGGGGSGGGIQNVSGTVDLPNTPGIVEVYATAAATVEGVELAAGDAAVFRYFSDEWTYMVVGEHTTWQSLALISVTPATPTADDNADTITWTPTTGVEYVIGGQVRTPPYSVGDVTASVTVTAQATTGYTLTGTTSWTFNFTGSAPADVTPPTGGTLAVTGSGDAGTTRTLTVSGASDAGSGLHAAPYAFSLDGGATWSTYQSSASYTTAALAAGTYQPRARVRDAASTPNVATVSAANFTVNAATPSTLRADDFTAANGTDLHGRTLPTGGGTWTVSSGTGKIDINDNQARRRSTAADGTLATFPAPGQTNFDLSTTGMSFAHTSSFPALVFRHADAQNFCYVSLNPSDGRVFLYKVVAGAHTKITESATGAFPSTTLVPHSMLIQVRGTSCAVTLDGTVVINAATIPAYATGQDNAGLRVGASGTAEIRWYDISIDTGVSA